MTLVATPFGWLDGLAGEIDLRRQSIDPSLVASARVQIVGRAALARAALMAPVFMVDEASSAAYETARLKLAAAVSARKGVVFDADEWRSLVAWQAIGGSVLARDGRIRWVPSRDADVRAARSTTGASDALPDLSRGVFVADGRGVSHPDPTAREALRAGRGALCLLRRARRTSSASSGDFVTAVRGETTGGGLADFDRVAVLGDGAELPALRVRQPDFQAAAFPVVAAIAGGVVLALGTYGIWSWRDTTKAEIEAKNAPAIAAAQGLIAALLQDQQDAAKTGRALNPDLLSGIKKIATLPSDSSEWSAPLGTLAIGAGLAVAAGYAIKKFRGGRR